LSTIEETVASTLNERGQSGYSQYAAPVVTALVNREQQIVGHLIEFARQQDLNVDAVREALTEAGMHMPPPAAVPDSTPRMDGDPAQQDSNDLGAVLGRIEETLSGLVGFARENGYRG
jgi:hypothetical protein